MAESFEDATISEHEKVHRGHIGHSTVSSGLNYRHGAIEAKLDTM